MATFYAKTFLKLLIRIYQFFISPWLSLAAGPASGCRFPISCSRFAYKILEKKSILGSCYFTIRRLSRCHHWNCFSHTKFFIDKRKSSNHAKSLYFSIRPVTRFYVGLGKARHATTHGNSSSHDSSSQ